MTPLKNLSRKQTVLASRQRRLNGVSGISPKSTLAFCARWLLAFAILMAPWPGVTDAYGNAYRWCANASFRVVSPESRIRVTPLSPFSQENDCEISASVHRGEHKIEGKVKLNSMLQGYLPFTFALALVIASPMTHRRKLQAVIWAVVTVHVYVIARAVVIMLLAFSGSSPGAIFVVTSLTEKFVHAGRWIMLNTLVGYFAVPIVIWVVLMSFFARRPLVSL